MAATGSIYYASSYAYSLPSLYNYGADYEFNYTPFEKLTFFGNYTYSAKKYDYNGLPNSRLLNLSPRNKAKVSVRYTLKKGWLLTSDLYYNGTGGTQGGGTLPQYFVADVGVDKILAGHLKLSFFVNNVTGTKYEQVFGYPMPRQTYGIRLQFNTKKKG